LNRLLPSHPRKRTTTPPTMVTVNGSEGKAIQLTV